MRLQLIMDEDYGCDFVTKDGGGAGVSPALLYQQCTGSSVVGNWVGCINRNNNGFFLMVILVI